jgi:A/G-specific adenine glycosylase
MAFAYDKPVVVVETNIRAVFIHFFFPNSKKVLDSKLTPLIEKYMDSAHPREWYNALMDYGAMLKKIVPNPSRKSNTHTIQSPFKGSVRQVRGAIIKAYAENGDATKDTFARILPYAEDVIRDQYKKLEIEGFFD